jgi:hypothetical protein
LDRNRRGKKTAGKTGSTARSNEVPDTGQSNFGFLLE